MGDYMLDDNEDSDEFKEDDEDFSDKDSMFSYNYSTFNVSELLSLSPFPDVDLFLFVSICHS